MKRQSERASAPGLLLIWQKRRLRQIDVELAELTAELAPFGRGFCDACGGVVGPGPARESARK